VEKKFPGAARASSFSFVKQFLGRSRWYREACKFPVITCYIAHFLDILEPSV
jgi:hypothetical protein